MNTSLALALAALAPVAAPVAAQTPAKATAPAPVMPSGLTTLEQRVYAFAASQSAATPEERYAWRRLHARVALSEKDWAISARCGIETLAFWREANSMPAAIEAAEAQSARLYADYAAEMRAQRMEALASRIAAAFERVADTLAPVAAPPAPVAQLPDAVEARFAAVEAANAANAEILAAIAAKVGVTP